jgi:subtilisin family serine protease
MTSAKLISKCAPLLACTVLATFAAGSSGTSALQRAPFTPVGELPPTAARLKLAAPGSRLDAAVARVIAAADPLAQARADGLVVRAAMVQVLVGAVPGATETLTAWLEANGARLVSGAGDLVQADVSPELLRRLVTLPDVMGVRRPSYAPKPDPRHRALAATAAAGAFTTEGLAAMNAPAWHTAGYTGQGVKVGVIDAEFGGWDALRGSELPDAAKTHFQAFGGTAVGDGTHGTACAEIIHDIAPSAEMYLALVATQVDIANAVDWMKANGVKVISMSLGWLSWGPGDGTGYLADVVNGFVAGGGVWVNSAGNSRLAHWQGTWRDDTGNGYLNYSSASEVNYITADGFNAAIVPAGTTITASLVWNQWSSPATDLDFYLYKDNGSGLEMVKGSEDLQDGTAGQFPVEEFSFTTTEDAAYGFVIKGVSGPANVEIEFFNRLDANPLLFNVQDGSLTPPADAAGAIAAAALDAGAPYALEDYSSRGPTNGPGGSLLGGSIKPDISGYAVVSTQSYGGRGSDHAFAGTSSACPHVAGAAALVRSAYPAYTAAQVRSLLETRAVDAGPGGKDVDYGYGRLYLGTPPAAACDAPGVPGFVSVAPSIVNSGTPYTITWTAPANATGYELQEATNSGFTGAATATGNTTSASVTHTVGSDTTYYYRVRAVRSCGATSASSAYSTTLSVTVKAGSVTTVSLWVPVATRAAGANASQWRTDLGLLNLGGAAATCTVVYKSGATVKTYQTTVAGGRHVILRDVVGAGYLAGSGSGSLEVRSSQAVLVTSRTYNQNANGTFGQDYPSYGPTEGLSAGQTATLPHLTENTAYRSNIGLVNMGAAVATVTVALIDGATGAQAGSYQVTLQPGEWKQESQPFLKKAGRNNLEAGYARVSVTAGSGVVAVASVIDNSAASNDPTTITMQR